MLVVRVLSDGRRCSILPIRPSFGNAEQKIGISIFGVQCQDLFEVRDGVLVCLRRHKSEGFLFILPDFKPGLEIVDSRHTLN